MNLLLVSLETTGRGWVTMVTWELQKRANMWFMLHSSGTFEIKSAHSVQIVYQIWCCCQTSAFEHVPASRTTPRLPWQPQLTGTTCTAGTLQVMESSDDDPAYVVKFKSTFRPDLETRKQNANIVYVKAVAALEPDSRSSSVYPDLTELTEGTEGCWRETCGSNNIRATREKVALLVLHQSVNRRKTQLRTVWWIQSRAHHQYRGLSIRVLLQTCSTCTWPQLQHLYLWELVLCCCSYCTEEEFLHHQKMSVSLCLSSWLGAEEEEHVKSEEDKCSSCCQLNLDYWKSFSLSCFWLRFSKGNPAQTHTSHTQSPAQ